jgi:excisionase family DNA binding protein
MSERTQEPRSGTRLYSVSKVANRLDVSQDTVRRLIDRGDLMAIRIGSSVRVLAVDLESFVERRLGDER